MSEMNGFDLTAQALSNMTRYYYNHQIQGMEKIPSTGGAILVWYHGVVPIDYVALVARLYLRDGRMVHSVVHRNRVEQSHWTRIGDTLLSLVKPYYAGTNVYAITTHPQWGILFLPVCCYGSGSIGAFMS